MSRKPGTSDWIIGIFIAAAIFGGGGGMKGCDNAGGTGPSNDGPKPKQSAVCNEYFRGGC